MKGNWGGVGTTSVNCLTWAILSLDDMGRVKQPCRIGSADAEHEATLRRGGLGCYSILVARGIRGV